jgi:hypothetical protein
VAILKARESPTVPAAYSARLCQHENDPLRMTTNVHTSV